MGYRPITSVGAIPPNIISLSDVCNQSASKNGIAYTDYLSPHKLALLATIEVYCMRLVSPEDLFKLFFFILECVEVHTY